MDYSLKERLHLLNKHKEIIATRDDLYLEYATLLNLTGEYEQAMQLIDQRQFHPWEGGEGKVPAQYQYARTISKEISKGRRIRACTCLD